MLKLGRSRSSRQWASRSAENVGDRLPATTAAIFAHERAHGRRFRRLFCAIRGKSCTSLQRWHTHGLIRDGPATRLVRSSAPPPEWMAMVACRDDPLSSRGAAREGSERFAWPQRGSLPRAFYTRRALRRRLGCANAAPAPRPRAETRV